MALLYKSEYRPDLFKKFRKKSIIEEIIEDNTTKTETNLNFESMEDLSKRFKDVKKKRKRRKKREKLADFVDLVFVGLKIGLNLSDQVTKPQNGFKLR